MSELLHNMSAPPRSEVKFKQQQLKKYVAFNPIILARLLGEKNIRIAGLEEKVKNYYETHNYIENSIKKPTGYMIAETIEFNGVNRFSKQLKNKMEKYVYEECNNTELLILVFCSTVGDLYIPNRKLSFESTKFDKILLFPEEEVNS
ncbi:MAG: hypothetical protein K5765_07690 [Clostridia bacterium]|nr:hypothetical protein [Clostridia bacterium]